MNNVIIQHEKGLFTILKIVVILNNSMCDTPPQLYPDSLQDSSCHRHDLIPGGGGGVL